MNTHAGPVAEAFLTPPPARAPTPHDVIRRLTDRRRVLGILGSDLSRALGVRDFEFAHWECGSVTPPFPVVCAWATALGFDLLGERPQ